MEVIFLDGLDCTNSTQQEHYSQVIQIVKDKCAATDQFLHTTHGKLDYVQAAFDMMYVLSKGIGIFGYPLENSCSLALYSYLKKNIDAKIKSGDATSTLTLVGFSLGTLMITSALICLMHKGRKYKNFIKNNVNIIFLACVVPEFKVASITKQVYSLQYFVNADDPIAMLFCKGVKVSTNGHVWNNYVDYIQNCKVFAQ